MESVNLNAVTYSNEMDDGNFDVSRNGMWWALFINLYCYAHVARSSNGQILLVDDKNGWRTK